MFLQHLDYISSVSKREFIFREYITFIATLLYFYIFKHALDTSHPRQHASAAWTSLRCGGGFHPASTCSAFSPLSAARNEVPALDWRGVAQVPEIWPFHQSPVQLPADFVGGKRKVAALFAPGPGPLAGPGNARGSDRQRRAGNAPGVSMQSTAARQEKTRVGNAIFPVLHKLAMTAKKYAP